MAVESSRAEASVEYWAQKWRVVRHEVDLQGVERVEAAAADPSWECVKSTVLVPRSPDNPGIGIALVEAGSQGDVGLVLVEGTAPGSNAESLPAGALQCGDVISAVGEPGKVKVSTDGLVYDRLVEVLTGLDPAAGGVELEVKRLRKRPSVKLTVKFPESEGKADAEVRLFAGANLRQTMLANGVDLNDPLARRFDAGIGTGDCGGEGCCCTCAVDVLNGQDLLSEQKTQERQIMKEFPRWRLACKAFVAELEEDAEMVVRATPRGFDGFYGAEECDINGKPLKRPNQAS